MPSNRNRSGESARRREKSLLLNICLRCSGPRDSDSLVCNSCLEKRRQKRRDKDAQRKSDNLCRCGRKPEDGKELCKDCLQQARKNAEIQRSKHIKSGGCITCGKPPMPGTMTCAGCAARATDATIRRYNQNKKNGVCPFCGGQLGSNFRCDSCHKNHLKRSKEMQYRIRQQKGLFRF